MRDEMAMHVDPVKLWNAALAIMADGLPVGTRGRVTLVVMPDGRTRPPVARYCIVTSAGPVLADLHDLPLDAMTGSPLDLSALARLPRPLADAVLDMACTAVLQVLPADARARIVSHARADDSPVEGEEHLDLTLDGFWSGPLRMVVHGDRAVLAALLRDHVTGSSGGGAIADRIAAAVPMPCSFRLGPRDLSLARLRGVGTGDLILPGAGGIRFCAPHASHFLIQDGTQWTIGPLAMTDDLPQPMPEGAAPQASASEPEARDIGDIPVRLSFVLAEQTMTLAELQALRTGALLPVDPPTTEAGQSVRLLVNGRAAGEGSLVDLDGQPAVRVARLFGV